MHTVRTFAVKASLPPGLEDLGYVINNLFWSWNTDMVDLFRRIDYGLWVGHGHNPMKMIGSVSQARLDDLAGNDGFIYQIRQAREKLDECLNAPTWYDKVYGSKADTAKPIIAYFSAEFGIHECLPIYSGGLGMLAGDHLKSASDLGVPLVGVGLLYQKGYFRQYLNTDGWQQEHYIDNDFHNMPIQLVRKKTDHPLMVGVQMPGRTVLAQVWKVSVGRVSLYLLDTNIQNNSPEDRAITNALYGGGAESRICQEIILGIGGLKALYAMDMEPAVCHMNEGHAAFMALERIRRLRVSRNISFEEAAEIARACNVFTVHTPVAAGNDEFAPELIDKYFSHYYGKLGINRNQFLGLGRIKQEDNSEAFKMPVLALRMSSYRNGVSQLHGQVSRRLWSGLWPDLPLDEVPIQAITNGVHAKTWLSTDMNLLLERYLGSRWADEIVDKSIWQNIEQVPDEEIWRIHQRCKDKLVTFVRKRLKKQLQRRGAFHTELDWAEEVLDPEALTIGFARRFATYKRGYLLFRDKERLIRLLTDTARPVQIIFSGKAHPRDTEGKEIIRQIVHFASEHAAVRRRLVFLEDYDMDIARYLVQGVDVWLNNPRRPMEASGTSGMKAALNGVLNMSTLDGWWCEGYTPDSGWIIGAGEEYEDVSYQDAVESEAIFNLLEQEVVPLYYSRSSDKLPRGWIKRIKGTLRWCTPRFNTSRMVAEYTRKFYTPAASKWKDLTFADMQKIRALSVWKANVRSAWSDLAFQDVAVETEQGEQLCQLNGKQPQLLVGSQLKVIASVRTGRLKPEDISVEIYHGQVDSSGNIENGEVCVMKYMPNGEDQGAARFAGLIPCTSSGRQGFSLRILPRHPDLSEAYEPGMILWESKH